MKTKEGQAASSGAMLLRIDRAVLLDCAAQRDEDKGYIQAAEEKYKSALKLLLSAEEGIDDVHPPKLSKKNLRRWKVSVCGTMHNLGLLYSKQDGKLDLARQMLAGSAHLASQVESGEGISLENISHTMDVLEKVKEKIAIKNGKDHTTGV